MFNFEIYCLFIQFIDIETKIQTSDFDLDVGDHLVKTIMKVLPFLYIIERFFHSYFGVQYPLNVFETTKYLLFFNIEKYTITKNTILIIGSDYSYTCITILRLVQCGTENFHCTYPLFIAVYMAILV